MANILGVEASEAAGKARVPEPVKRGWRDGVAGGSLDTARALRSKGV